MNHKAEPLRCRRRAPERGVEPVEGQKGVKPTIDPWQIKCDGKIKKQTEKIQDHIDKGQRQT